MSSKFSTKREIVYTKGEARPREIFTILDKTGSVVHKTVRPLLVLFRVQDIVKMIVGATLIAIPLSYTQEAWVLAEELHIFNIFILWIISFVFIVSFMYFNIYRHHLSGHVFEFIKRVIGLYLISFCVSAIFLTAIDKVPWSFDLILSIKRILLVAIPASISAAITDLFK